MKRVISILFLCSAFIRYSNACPVCTLRVANNKTPFFSADYYKPRIKEENKRVKSQIAENESVEYGKRESKQRQTQEVEAENLAEQMGDL